MRIDDEAKRDERESSGLLPIILGAVLALGALVHLAPEQRIAFDQAGLGIGTTGNFGPSGGERYHCTSLENGAPCMRAANAHGEMRRMLWLGGSQLHGINNRQPDDRTAVVLAHERMLNQGVFLTAFSMPNGNFQEFQALFDHLRHATRVDVLVLGAVYDDMREVGVRASIADHIRVAPASAAKVTPSHEDVAQTPDKTLNTQQRAEAYLDDRLGDFANVWAARADFRGQLVVALDAARRWLLIARNALLGIDSTKWTVRIDKAQYAVNKAALAEILQSARQANIPVLLYVAPRPIDAYFPYNLGEYKAFKRDIAGLAQQHGAHFADLEDAVVGNVWGTIDNGVGEIVTDIFHFQAAGHRQLAEGVVKALAPVLGEGAKP